MKTIKEKLKIRQIYLLVSLTTVWSFVANAKIVYEPERCFQKIENLDIKLNNQKKSKDTIRLSCALRIFNQTEVIEYNNFSLSFSKDSMAIVDSNGVWKVLSGDVLFVEKNENSKTNKSIYIYSSVGVYKIKGTVGVSSEKEKIYLLALNGEMSIADNFEYQKFKETGISEIPNGYKKWISKNKVFPNIEYGVLELIEPKETLEYISKVKAVSYVTLKNILINLNSNKEQRKEELNGYYQQVTQRRIASIEEKNEKEKIKADREKKLTENLLMKFRRRAWLHEF